MARRAYLADRSWFAERRAGAPLAGVAYFSMEFGLGSALPLYAGGLGVLAGDFLKAASDLGVPVIGIGLLYQEGYFHQMIDAEGRQFEAFPYNDPSSMPVEPARTAEGAWLHIPVELPGRTLRLRAWRVIVGRTLLYLLDTNDPVNGPVDRGIAGKLYGGGSEMRLMQELVLGVGGWRLVEALHPEIEVCHLNEGHAAFAMLERARQFARRNGLSFAEALWATRAGNVFTTHTPVDAGFDRFPLHLFARYAQAWAGGRALRWPMSWQLGLEDGRASGGMFNMAWLATRGALLSFGVSRLHGVGLPADFPAACTRAGRSRRCRSITSPTACMCRPGIPPWPMRSGPRPAARIAGATSRRIWAAHRRPSSTKRCGPCAASAREALVREVRARLAVATERTRPSARGRGARRDGARSQRSDPRLRAPLHRL